MMGFLAMVISIAAIIIILAPDSEYFDTEKFIIGVAVIIVLGIAFHAPTPH